MDPSYVTGTVQRSDAVVPAVDYTFPGSSYTLDSYEIPDEPNAECYVWDGINNGLFADMAPATPEDAHPTSPNMRPVWTCYLSRNGAPDAGSITWDAGPCPTVGPDGVEANMHPSGKTTAQLTTDSTNKVAVTGAAAYVDGIWTMERFMQTQEAIWKAEDDAREAYLTEITNRASVKTATTQGVADNTSPVTKAECTQGQYPGRFSGAQFGYSTCSFWLTRFCLEAIDLVRVKANNVVGVDNTVEGGATLLGWSNSYTGPYYATAYIAHNTINAFYPDITSEGIYLSDSLATAYLLPSDAQILNGGEHIIWANSGYGQNGNFHYYEFWTTQPGFRLDTSRSTIKPGFIIHKNGRWDNTATMYAYNKGVDVDITPIPESPYCEITGWTYTKNDNTEGTIAQAACGAAPSNPAGAPTRTTPLGSGNSPGISEKDGSYCGQPFEGASCRCRDCYLADRSCNNPG